MTCILNSWMAIEILILYVSNWQFRILRRTWTIEIIITCIEKHRTWSWLQTVHKLYILNLACLFSTTMLALTLTKQIVYMNRNKSIFTQWEAISKKFFQYFLTFNNPLTHPVTQIIYFSSPWCPSTTTSGWVCSPAPRATKLLCTHPGCTATRPTSPESTADSFP